jgi:hypothetical protein
MTCEVFDYWTTSFYMVENESHDEIKKEALNYIYNSLEPEIVVSPRAKGGGLRETNFELFHRAKEADVEGYGVGSIHDFCIKGIATAVCHKNKISADEISVKMLDSWAHVSNDYGYHDAHNHPNCSWCGIYCVEAGESSSETLNGINRFYSPLNSMTLDDMGSHYLATNSNDYSPKDGVLIVFPSYLMHSALPYSGKTDRVVISFNTIIEKNPLTDYEESMKTYAKALSGTITMRS